MPSTTSGQSPREVPRVLRQAVALRRSQAMASACDIEALCQRAAVMARRRAIPHAGVILQTFNPTETAEIPFPIS